VCTNGIANEDIDFTLVTQLSPIRLGIMKEQCKRWGHHPISLALASKIASKQAISRALLAMGCMRTTVTIVREFDDYPLNRLQNEALAAIETSHAVYVDADFLVSSSLYAELYEQKSQLHDPKVALVIPAFELRPLCDPGIPSCQELHKLTVPNTKMELLELYYVTNGPEATIAQFDSKKNLAGHASTRFIDWTTQESGALLPIECITSPRCELCAIAEICLLSKKPFGLRKKKLTWMQQVHRSGYRLFQLADSFLVHLLHAKSPSFKTWDKTKKTLGRESLHVEHVAKVFEEWMEATIPDQKAMSLCPSEEEQELDAVIVDESDEEFEMMSDLVMTTHTV